LLLKFLPIELSWITPAELGPAQPQLVSVALKLNYNSNKWYLHGIAKSLNGKNLGGIGLTLSSSPVGLSWNFWVTISNPFSILLFKIFVPFYPLHTHSCFSLNPSMDRLPTYLLGWPLRNHTQWYSSWQILSYALPSPSVLVSPSLSGDCWYPPYCSLWRPSSPVIWRLLISFLPQPVETFFPSISLLVDFSMSIYWWNKYVIKRREWKRLVKSFVFS